MYLEYLITKRVVYPLKNQNMYIFLHGALSDTLVWRQTDGFNENYDQINTCSPAYARNIRL